MIPGQYLARSLVSQVTDLRVQQPGLVRELAGRRRRRQSLAPDGHLMIIAADHPARYVVRAGENAWAMANRAGYLERIVRVLVHPEIDGVMASPDLIDELFLLNHVVTQAGGPDFLAEKVLIGSINRGGLAGAAWELDDPVTAYRASDLARHHLDAGKLLLRLNLEEAASLRTIMHCVGALTELAELDLPAFLEPLPVFRAESGGWAVSKQPHDLVRLVGVATALGPGTARLWLKLPMVPEFERVAAATTCPIVLLGGDGSPDPAALLSAIGEATSAAGNVRGLMIGRSVLYPAGDEDPQAVAVAAARVARRQWTAAEAAAGLTLLRGQDPTLIQGAGIGG